MKEKNNGTFEIAVKLNPYYSCRKCVKKGRYYVDSKPSAYVSMYIYSNGKLFSKGEVSISKTFNPYESTISTFIKKQKLMSQLTSGDYYVGIKSKGTASVTLHKDCKLKYLCDPNEDD